MAVHTLRPRGTRGEEDERPSGIPEKGRLGASRNEMLYLLVGLLVFALIFVAFWYEATH